MRVPLFTDAIVFCMRLPLVLSAEVSRDRGRPESVAFEPRRRNGGIVFEPCKRFSVESWQLGDLARDFSKEKWAGVVNLMDLREAWGDFCRGQMHNKKGKVFPIFVFFFQFGVTDQIIRCTPKKPKIFNCFSDLVVLFNPHVSFARGMLVYWMASATPRVSFIHATVVSDVSGEASCNSKGIVSCSEHLKFIRLTH